PVYNAAGEIVGMQGIFWDITEQKRAQEDLVASRERFALAVQGSTAGIWDWDIATNEIYFSSRFRELLGHGSDELENRFIEWENRMHPDDQEMALAAIDNHLQSDAPFDVEYRLLCKDDDYRWFRVRGLAVRNGKGKATRMAGSISDITTRKEAESQLHERTADLERSNRDLEQFAYIASHDLKEPLRMVTSYVQLLEHRYKDKLDDDARDFIGFAVDGSKRMKRLIDGLLEFSRIGTHGREFAPTHTEGVLEESLSNLEVLIREKEAKVTHDPLPDVIADPLQLGQLFQNLVGNALKFCKDVPQVHISVERDKTAEQVIISVKDNGIGINPDHVEKIFQIYQRLHRRADYEGTGIGLAVCRKIVERHGGEIRVDSELGQGSTFHFNMKAVASES
ncbi:MAG: sensor histidine kinase, partial [Verrucomicrobiales bacterium]